MKRLFLIFKTKNLCNGSPKQDIAFLCTYLATFYKTLNISSKSIEQLLCCTHIQNQLDLWAYSNVRNLK
jgi:hypothetical protein